MAKDQASPDEPDEVLSASDSAQLAELNAHFPGVQSIDPDEVQERMAGRMRNADSLDELFDALSGSNSKGMVGKTFEFRNVTWQPYQAARGIIPLAVCEVVNTATGESEEFITTGGMVVEFLRRAQQLDAYPFVARIEDKTTRSGQTALNLVRA